MKATNCSNQESRNAWGIKWLNGYDVRFSRWRCGVQILSKGLCVFFGQENLSLYSPWRLTYSFFHCHEKTQWPITPENNTELFVWGKPNDQLLLKTIQLFVWEKPNDQLSLRTIQSYLSLSFLCLCEAWAWVKNMAFIITPMKPVALNLGHWHPWYYKRDQKKNR